MWLPDVSKGSLGSSSISEPVLKMVCLFHTLTTFGARFAFTSTFRKSLWDFLIDSWLMELTCHLYHYVMGSQTGFPGVPRIPARVPRVPMFSSLPPSEVLLQFKALFVFLLNIH